MMWPPLEKALLLKTQLAHLDVSWGCFSVSQVGRNVTAFRMMTALCCIWLFFRTMCSVHRRKHSMCWLTHCLDVIDFTNSLLNTGGALNKECKECHLIYAVCFIFEQLYILTHFKVVTCVYCTVYTVLYCTKSNLIRNLFFELVICVVGAAQWPQISLLLYSAAFRCECDQGVPEKENSVSVEQ